MLHPDDAHDLPRRVNDMAIDDSPDSSEGQEIARALHNHHGSSGSIRGMFRRASMSIRGAIQRRPSGSFLSEDTILEQGQETHTPGTSARPTTAHATWNKLRGRRSFRQSTPYLGFDLMREEPRDISPLSSNPQPLNPSHSAVPGNRDEPPIIPVNSGAAAKASVALTNEQMHRYNLRGRLLEANTCSDDSNDRESGIGITVTLSGSGDEVIEEVEGHPTTEDIRISRIDFISRLPLELAIQVLATLDANALTSVCRVSKAWNKVASNTHIWRESCLRELGATYATSGPVQPNTGQGIPRVLPESDWKKIYKAKYELNQKWREGKATPIYLHGHTDSIYCLQFDE